MKRTFLVAYDYGTGGAWAFLVAESADQVSDRFPELEIFEQPPSWMTDETLAALRQRMTIDIDETENLFLSSLIRGRENDG